MRSIKLFGKSLTKSKANDSTCTIDEDLVEKSTKSKYKEEEEILTDGSMCFKRGNKTFTESLAAATEYYRRGAEEFDHAKCQLALGELYYSRGANVNLDLAAYWLKKAINNGVSEYEAFLILGILYLTGGDGFTINEVEAFQWIEKAAAYTTGCYELLGYAYYQGISLRVKHIRSAPFIKNYRKSLDWYLKTVETFPTNDIPATEIANIYFKGGFGVEKDYRKALFWSEEFWGENSKSKECNEIAATIYKEGGYGIQQDAQRALKLCLDSSLYFDAGEICQFYIYPPDFKNAIQYYEEASKQSEDVCIQAKERLGYIHLKGLGVKKNFSLATSYFIGDFILSESNFPMPAPSYIDVDKLPSFSENFSFQKHDLISHYYVGFLYHYGFGTAIIDYSRAHYFYSQCSQSRFYGKAMNQIGVLHRDGLGCLQDFEEAIRFFKLSAENNCHDAFNSLGDMYKQGYGVDVDYEEAFKWYCKAAEEPMDNGGQFNLAVMYSEGKGTPINYKLALQWFEKAHNYGNENATEFVIAQTKLLIELSERIAIVEGYNSLENRRTNEQSPMTKTLPKMFHVENVQQ
ncbi:unnamed protein product [Mucor hiemalis]